MKLLKSLLLGTLVVAGFAAGASAQTEIYICGSTAYRGGVTKAIQDLLFTSGTGFAEAESASPVYGASAALFKGSVVLNSSTTSYIVHTYWTGSLAGCVDVAAGNTITTFMADSDATTNVTAAPTTSSTTVGAYTDGNNLGSGYTTTSAVPNVAMSDSFASSVAKSITGSVSTTGPISIKTIVNDIKNNLVQASGTGSESVTGVLPFVWVSGATGGATGNTQATVAAPFTNITQEAASQLIQTGYVPVESLGVTSDTNDYAFLIGRNEDSGTRICAQAESQVGSAYGAQSFGRVMNQYYVLFTTGTAAPAHDGVFTTGTIAATGDNDGTLQGQNIQDGGAGAVVSDIGAWPANAPLNTETSITWDQYGHSGQIGGGDVAKVLEAGNPLTLNITAVDTDDLNGTQVLANGNTVGNSAPNNWIPGTSKAYLIGYLGSADAGGIAATGAACTYLTYNGIPYTAANIQNGLYDFWSFEHTYLNTNTVTAGVSTFAGQLVDQVYFQDCQTDSSGLTDTEVSPTDQKVGGIEFTNVHFTKTQEGAAIAPLF
jgi:hypothetical protein